MDFPFERIPSFEGCMENWKKIKISECGERLVSLVGIHPRIMVSPQYYLRNIKGAIDDCFVRETVAQKLIRVAESLPDHLHIVILDGWRSTEVQKCLFEDYKTIVRKEYPLLDEENLNKKVSQFVSVPSSNPLCPSPHNTGGAVDLTLADSSNEFLEMGTSFDSFFPMDRITFFEELADIQTLSEKEEIYKQNRRLLYFLMVKAGFTNYHDEWWHFDFGNQFWASISGAKFARYGAISPFIENI